MRRGPDGESSATGHPSARYQAERDAGAQGDGAGTSARVCVETDGGMAEFDIGWEKGDGESSANSGASRKKSDREE